MHQVSRITVAVLALSLGFAGACRKQPVQVTPTPVQPPAPLPPAPRGPNADSAANAQRIRDSIAADAARRAAAAAEAARIAAENARTAAAEATRLRETLMAAVRFDYNISDLRDDARAALEAKVPILVANPTVMLTISGHADDRGSDEYNIALSARRATAIKQYLIDRNIAASRLQTTAYGEERPVCQQPEESCYAQNRRAEFQITAGPAMLKR